MNLFSPDTNVLTVLRVQTPFYFCCFRLPRWSVSIHVPPVSPQTQKMPADPLRQHRRASSCQSSSFPPKCQGVPDRHGPGSEDREETGQFLQRHHLQQPAHRAVRASAPQGIVFSFCNSFQLCYTRFRLWFSSSSQITKKQCCWSGALRLGFTSKDPSRINPDNLPKYACPDLVSQSSFWAKALPEEFANEGNVIAFWVDKKGRVFYRINESSPMLFFSGVRTAEPVWALIDVYGLTRGVQLLGKTRTCHHWEIRITGLISSSDMTKGGSFSFTSKSRCFRVFLAPRCFSCQHPIS